MSVKTRLRQLGSAALWPLRHLRRKFVKTALTPLAWAVANRAGYDELWRHAADPLDGLELAYLEAQKYLIPDDCQMCTSRIKSGVDRAISLSDGSRNWVAAEALLIRRQIEIAELLRERGNRKLMRGARPHRPRLVLRGRAARADQGRRAYRPARAGG